MSASNKVPENLNYLSNVSFRLTMEDAPHMTWFCQAANIPGVSIDAIEIFNPTATIPVAGSRVSFEELSVRFIVDEHMKNWTEIYDRIIALRKYKKSFANSKQVVQIQLQEVEQFLLLFSHF